MLLQVGLDQLGEKSRPTAYIIVIVLIFNFQIYVIVLARVSARPCLAICVNSSLYNIKFSEESFVDCSDRKRD